MALGLSQAEFAARYMLPIGSIRDWEQGRCKMDASATGYYSAIQADPEGVAKARKKVLPAA